MSNLPQEGLSRRRTSQRMRLKQLRNLDQYKILNPYKQRPTPSLPPELVKQLKKLTHLSTTAIRLLSLPSTSPLSYNNIQQMEQAHLEQSTRFKEVIGDEEYPLEGQLGSIQPPKHQEGIGIIQPMEGESQSQAHPTHPSLGSGGAQRIQDFHLHLFQDRSNLHLPQDRLNLHQDNLFESREHVHPPAEQQCHDSQPPLQFEDYEQYLNS